MSALPVVLRLDRAGDVGRRVDDVPALNRVEAPSVNRVAPEPPVARAPEAKSFDPPDPATRRSGPDADGGNAGGRQRGANDPPCNSFTAETGVLMADGSVVAIEDVELGDWVLAADPETGELGPRQVTRLIFGSGQKTLVGITVDGATVTATDEHPIWVDSDGDWVDAEDVQVGDVLLTPDGVAVVDAVAVETVASAEVFNLTVDDLHTFYVLVGDTPVLTHNSNCPDAPYAKFNQAHRDSLPSPKGEGPNGGRLQSHHGLQRQWADQNLPAYDANLAPTMTIETGVGLPHTTISNARRNVRSAAGEGRWSSSLDDELGFVVGDLRTAGFGDDVVQSALNQQYSMMDKLGVAYIRLLGF